jgi:prephenate dehydrogenase
MNDSDFRRCDIVIAGLGVIGGSVAKSLWKAGCNRIYACDRDQSALRNAESGGVIRQGFSDFSHVPMADIIICCLPPHLVTDCYRQLAPRLKKGGVVAEMSGLKTQIVPELEEALLDGHELLPLHPMAGSEKAGYLYSDTHMFVDAMLIRVTSTRTKDNARRWAKVLLDAMRCREMRELTAPAHDAVIARVSHIPHVAALAIRAMTQRDIPFGGGSYHAITRVADINAPLWAGLLMGNREYLMDSITQLKEKLTVIENTILGGDTDALTQLLSDIAKPQE